eukprot:CAMPEP_0117649952 /NCGR_PEP_ID=MMETSP0804-20121206/1273_1 /TAXON_ID=1074897 /ORGANISM="Tetraselmis astigmatica, Strain CCMP880" /LENGTH=76 /DNA_ID=CAMNT_0005455777 /DNA_START=892 /DNA_END=1122 /DNA_ORIENTATION=+
MEVKGSIRDSCVGSAISGGFGTGAPTGRLTISPAGAGGVVSVINHFEVTHRVWHSPTETWPSGSVLMALGLPSLSM